MSTRIVIADPSKLLRGAIGTALAAEGIESVIVNNTDQLLIAIGSKPTSCVLLDADLCPGGWFACLKRIRGINFTVRVPIILVAGSPTRALVIEAARAGVADVIIRSREMAAVVVARLRRLGIAPDRDDDHAHPNDPSPRAAHPRPMAEPPPAPEPFPAEAPEVIPAAAPARPHGLTIDQSVAAAEAELKATAPLIGRTQLLELVDAQGTLRALSPIARQVLLLSSSPGGSLDEMAKVVKQDAAISVKILRVANSSAYAGGTRIDSVHRAVSRLGMAHIRDIVLNMEIMDGFNGEWCEKIRSDWFWEHSIAVGLISSRLARKANLGADITDAMFTAGLLHDIGRMLLAVVLPQHYPTVLRTADSLGLPLEVVESRLLMVDHAELSNRVLRSWRFPPELINPIAFHHLTLDEVQRAVPRMVHSIGLLTVSDYLAHALLIGNSGNDVIYPTRAHLRGLAIDPAFLQELCNTIPQETSEMKMVLAAANSTGDIDAFDARVREQLHPVGPVLSISGDPGYDPFDYLAARLNEGRGERPKTAIIYVQSPGEAELAAGRLCEREAALSLKRLPTVVISPTGELTLPGDVASGRSIKLLPCPTPINKLITAMLTPIPQPKINTAA